MTHQTNPAAAVGIEDEGRYADNIQSALRYLYRETAKHNYPLTAHLIAVAAAALEDEAGHTAQACDKLQ